MCTDHTDLAPVEIRVARGDDSAAPGRITVRDEDIAYDLASDPLLALIPGFVAAFAAPSEPGVLRLSLPKGGFTVVFQPDRPGPELKAFYIRVSADGPQAIALVLDV